MTTAKQPPVRRYPRREATVYIAERISAPMATRSIINTDIPFTIINRRAMYAEADLDAYVTRVLANAPRRRHMPTRKPGVTASVPITA
jgi:hypothetical protein